MRLHNHRPTRHGVAAVEFAVCLPLMLLLLLGTWEVGRLVQVYQVLCNAAREGARIAAQGQIINLSGDYTQIKVNSGTPNVTSTVRNYLSGAGLSNSGLTVQFTFLNSSGNPVGTPTEPYQGTKGQRFRVTATLPFDSVRWSPTNLLNLSQIQSSVDWVSMIDDPFTLDTSLPGWNPLP